MEHQIESVGKVFVVVSDKRKCRERERRSVASMG